MKTLIRHASLLPLLCALLAPARAADSSGPNSGNVPWKIIQTSEPIYPLGLIAAGVTHGVARVRVSIAASGRLNDALVVFASRRAFGDEALRAVRQWRFEAERVNGEPINGVSEITFNFEVGGAVSISRREGAWAEGPEGPHDPQGYEAVSVKRLDHAPSLTHVVSPVHPKDPANRAITGSATLEFFVDETGQPRIPVVTASDHNLLGASAVAAVSQWRFEPPQANGRPVLIRVEQSFSFLPPRK